MIRCCSILIAVLLIASFAFTEANAASQADVFPLTTGTYWVYQGTTRAQGEDGRVVTEHRTCRMEITQTMRRGALTIAVVTGYPGDLPWSYSEPADGEHLLIRTASGDYYLVSGVTSEEVFAAAGDSSKLPESMSYNEELVLATPLIPGKTYAPMEPGIQREDTWYAWHVDSLRPMHLHGVRGVSRSRVVAKYRLAFRTCPDHIIVEFVSGIGITRFVYSHHGTVMDVDMRLVAFHRGGGS